MRTKSRRRGVRAGILVAAAAIATMAFGSSSAQAQVPFQAQLDNAYLKTGQFPNPGLDVLDSPDVVEIDGMITGAPNPGGENPFTVQAADFQFPTFFGSVVGGLAEVQVALEADENLSGSLNAANGNLAMDPSDFTATLWVDFTPDGTGGEPSEDQCEVSPIPMAFNTNQPFPSPYAGDPFDIVLPDLATDVIDNGAMAATWANLPAAQHVSGPGNCDVVDTLTGGRGGLWIGDGIEEPTINTDPGGGPGPGPGPGPNTDAFQACMKKAQAAFKKAKKKAKTKKAKKKAVQRKKAAFKKCRALL